MARNRTHRGVIRPTVPTPQTFFGSVAEIAEHLGITYRTASSLVNTPGYETRTSWRRMTEEEELEYYEPPRPPKERKKGVTYDKKQHWKITWFKNWKKGDKYPTGQPERIFSGTIAEFVEWQQCNISQVYRVIDYHYGQSTGTKLKSINGWSIARVRKYSKPYKRRSLEEIRNAV